MANAEEKRVMWIEGDIVTALSLAEGPLPAEWTRRFREWLVRRGETFGGVIREVGGDGSRLR